MDSYLNTEGLDTEDKEMLQAVAEAVTEWETVEPDFVIASITVRETGHISFHGDWSYETAERALRQALDEISEYAKKRKLPETLDCYRIDAETVDPFAPPPDDDSPF